MRATITKYYEFEAAHQLQHHLGPDGSPGKCSRPHGHTYRLEVQIEGEVRYDPSGSDHGFVMDFYDLGQIVKSRIVDRLDHRNLNDELPFRTTAENLAVWIFGDLSVAGELPIKQIRLWETSTGSVIVTRDQFEHLAYEALLRSKYQKAVGDGS